jgi:hypothetical protein
MFCSHIEVSACVISSLLKYYVLCTIIFLFIFTNLQTYYTVQDVDKFLTLISGNANRLFSFKLASLWQPNQLSLHSFIFTLVSNIIHIYSYNNNQIWNRDNNHNRIQKKNQCMISPMINCYW